MRQFHLLAQSCSIACSHKVILTCSHKVILACSQKVILARSHGAKLSLLKIDKVMIHLCRIKIILIYPYLLALVQSYSHSSHKVILIQHAA